MPQSCGYEFRGKGSVARGEIPVARHAFERGAVPDKTAARTLRLCSGQVERRYKRHTPFNLPITIFHLIGAVIAECLF